MGVKKKKKKTHTKNAITEMEKGNIYKCHHPAESMCFEFEEKERQRKEGGSRVCKREGGRECDKGKEKNRGSGGNGGRYSTSVCLDNLTASRQFN